MVAVAVMIAMAVPAMAAPASSGSNYGAGQSTDDVEVFAFASMCELTPVGAVTARIGGNGSTARISVYVGDKSVFTAPDRPINNAINTYTFAYNACWTLTVNVEVRGNSIVPGNTTGSWVLDCVCACVYLEDAYVVGWDEFYFEQGNVWRVTISNLVIDLVFSDGSTGTIVVGNHNVKSDANPGSSSQKTADVTIDGTVVGRVTYEAILSGYDEEYFVVDMDVFATPVFCRCCP